MLPIVDTHVHLWDTKRLRYPWLEGAPDLNRPFGVGDYQRACGPAPVEKLVFLQCDCDPSQYREEIDYVMECRARDARIVALVPWAPVDNGAAAEPELAALAANPLVKGVRRILQSEPDAAYCLRPAFVEGVRLLARFGLHFELCIVHAQLPAAIELVRRCPEVRFVLDHIGKPNIQKHVLQPWQANVRTLAGLPNVWCKVSGVATEADPQRWTADDLKPYVDHVIDCFGFGRVMFGSDWPVCTLATTIPRWIDTLQTLVRDAAEHDLRRLFHDTALAFYRI